MPVKRMFIGQFLGFLVLTISPAKAEEFNPGHMPSTYDDVRRPVSKEALVRAQGRIKRLDAFLRKRLAELGVSGQVSCSDHTTAAECRQDRNCRWQPNPESEGGRCVARGSSPENDTLAGLALLAISREVTKLGELIDQAVLAFPDPSFQVLTQQACANASTIKSQCQAAKPSASLPPVGLIKEAEFDPIIVEMDAVRSDLECS